MRILQKYIWDIYPAELELKKENQINKNDNFLDSNVLRYKIIDVTQNFKTNETILNLI